MMKSTQVVYIFFAFIAILGWNVWAIERDKKLFEAYDAGKIETAKEQYCSQLEVWHPDCKIE